MYAVIRAGGKQYRVAPGDVIEVEKLPQAGGEKCSLTKCWPSAAKKANWPSRRRRSSPGKWSSMSRGDKVLVFHFKRKKQYKKLKGIARPTPR